MIWLTAHEPVGLAIDTNQTDERVIAPRPMFCGGVIEMVGFRPDAQKWIVGDEGNCRRTKIRRIWHRLFRGGLMDASQPYQQDRQITGLEVHKSLDLRRDFLFNLLPTTRVSFHLFTILFLAPQF